MMNGTTKNLTLFLCLCLTGLSGCRLIVQPRLVAGDDLSEAPRFDPADYGFSIVCEKIDTGNPDRPGYVMEIEGDDVFRIRQSRDIVKTKYAPFTKTAVTKCRIGRRSYSVLLDTGNSVLPHITTTHILESDLPIYALTITDQQQTWDYGIAMIDELKIGRIKLINLPATYSAYYTGYNLFGLDIAPIGQDKQINLSLSVMQQFKYIRFDNIKKRMYFSKDESFEPKQPAEWKTYPLLNRGNHLYIQTTLEGIPVTLMIDTGSESDLFLTKACFDKLVRHHPRLEKTWKAKGYIYAPLAGGRFPAQARYVWGMTFDTCKYSLLTVAAVGQDGDGYAFFNDPLCDGLLGFPFFDDTVMVLDFERNLLWAKKCPWSRFEK